MKGRDRFGVLIALQRGHLSRFHVHDLHQVICIGYQQVTWEAFVLANLDRVVQRVAKMSVVVTIAHILCFSYQLKA